MNEEDCYETAETTEEEFSPDDNVGYKCNTWFPTISKWAKKATELSKDKNEGFRNIREISYLTPRLRVRRIGVYRSLRRDCARPRDRRMT